MNISIIIPYYNKNDLFKKTHKELKLQLDPTDEVLVIDDYSPNGVPELNCSCTRIIKPEFKLNPHQYRLNTLRNIGLSSAKYDSCLILDPDCIPNPNFIANAKKLFDPSILYAGRIHHIEADGSIRSDSRVKKDVSGWIDYGEKGQEGSMVWGGCMMFSRSKAALVGGFDEAFNGGWGAEEHEFASRMFHSGVRLYYSTELTVMHQHHYKQTPNHERNRELWRSRVDSFKKMLNLVTPYKPSIGVSVITMMRPDILDQCLRSVFRNRIPVKVRLDINGDYSTEMKYASEAWSHRWSVETVVHDRLWPAVIRNNALRWAKEKGFKYLLFLDDDCMAYSNSIPLLAQALDSHPEAVACSGFIRNANGREMMLGGPVEGGAFHYWRKSPGVRESSWVGGGFTMHRVDPLLPYDEEYQTGYNDYDWSLKATELGHKLIVCGDAGAHHGSRLTTEGFKPYTNPPSYNRVRYDESRHAEMRKLFKKKWGVEPRMGVVK